MMAALDMTADYNSNYGPAGGPEVAPSISLLVRSSVLAVRRMRIIAGYMYLRASSPSRRHTCALAAATLVRKTFASPIVGRV